MQLEKHVFCASDSFFESSHVFGWRLRHTHHKVPRLLWRLVLTSVCVGSDPHVVLHPDV